MVTLSLDSSVLIALMRVQSRDLVKAFASARRAEVPMMISVAVIHELVSGAAGGRQPKKEMAKLDRLLALLTPADLSVEDARASGGIRADLRRQGRGIGDIDTLIAGQAKARGWAVVTGNVRHFGRVDDLPVIDWTIGPGPLSAAEIARRIDAP